MFATKTSIFLMATHFQFMSPKILPKIHAIIIIHGTRIILNLVVKT